MDRMTFVPARRVPLYGRDFAFCNDVAGAGETDSLFEQNCGISHFPLIQMTLELCDNL